MKILNFGSINIDNSLTPYIIKKAKAKGMFICVNPAPISQEVISWPLSLVNLIILNEVEARELSGMNANNGEILNDLCQKYPNKEILLTLGKQGSYYARNDYREYSPGVDTEVVDTTGAGDTYIGYFLASRMGGLSVKASMDRASYASSITISKRGALDSIPKGV
jgi:ribokinase